MRRNKVKIILYSVIAIVVLFISLILFTGHSVHIALVKLVEISGDELVFETQSGDEIRAKSPSIIVPLLETGKKYTITVYDYRFQSPSLKKIKLSEVQ
ncbi:hypothetical protein SAMN05444162_4494 [Paenibacillaceae bacterium GAS479]|nr:hypothetical protein SAMN05444162_4494 [Paenibacillaceae bacterium GAS479]